MAAGGGSDGGGGGELGVVEGEVGKEGGEDTPGGMIVVGLPVILPVGSDAPMLVFISLPV